MKRAPKHKHPEGGGAGKKQKTTIDDYFSHHAPNIQRPGVSSEASIGLRPNDGPQPPSPGPSSGTGPNVSQQFPSPGTSSGTGPNVSQQFPSPGTSSGTEPNVSQQFSQPGPSSGDASVQQLPILKPIVYQQNLEFQEGPRYVFSIYKLGASIARVKEELKDNLKELQPEKKKKIGNFTINIYSSKTTKPPLYKPLIKQICGNAEEELNISTDHLLLLHCSTEQTSFAVCTGQLWTSIIKYVDISFPEACAKRLFDARSIELIKCGSLVGPIAESENLYRADHKFIPSIPDSISNYILEFILGIKEKASLYSIQALKMQNKGKGPPKNMKAHVWKGYVKLKFKITFNCLLEVLIHLSKIAQKHTTIDLELKEENDDIEGFVFYRYIQQTSQETENKLNVKLTEILQKFIGHSTEVGLLEDFVLDHNKHRAWRSSPNITLTYRKCPLESWSAPPSLQEMVEHIRAHTQRKLSSALLLQDYKLQFTSGKTPTSADILLYLEGKIDFEDRTYFKRGNHWFFITSEYLGILETRFSELISEGLIGPKSDDYLPLPWHPEKRFPVEFENFKDVGHQCHLEDHKGLFNELTARSWAMINEDGKSNVTYPFTFLKSSAVTKEIKEVIKVIKEGDENILFKIENMLNNQENWNVNQKIQEEFGDLAEGILGVLQMKRKVLAPKQKDIKRHLSDRTTTFVVQNMFIPASLNIRPDILMALNRHLRCCSLLDECEYNEMYMFPIESNQEYLVGDKIYKSSLAVELCDVLWNDKKNKTTYLYHVKNGFGISTRVACSQIRNSAHLLKQAITTDTTDDIIKKFWEEVTDYPGSAYYRLRMKERCPDLQGFRKLFTEAKVVYVYAFWSQTPNLLKPVSVTNSVTDILTPEERRVYGDVLNASQCTKDGEFTNHFRTMNQQRFIHCMRGSQQSQTAIKRLHKKIKGKIFASDSGSIVARMELMELHQVMQKSSFALRIMQIASSFTQEDGQ